MWQLGQIYTSDVKFFSVNVETEQTSRVSALAGDLPKRIIELWFSLFIHQVLSCNDFSVVLFLFIVNWVVG